MPDDHISSVFQEFDYSQKTSSSPGKLWCEIYGKRHDLFSGLVRHRNERVLAMVSGGHRLLDAGCGFGDFLYFLREQYDELYGFDPSIDMVHQTQHNLEIRGCSDKAHVQQGLAEDTGLEKGTFDTILMLDVLEHIHTDKRPSALDEMYSLLRSGGELFVVTPSLWHIRFYAALDNILTLPTYLRTKPRPSFFGADYKPLTEVFYTKRQVKNIIEKAGFKICHFERVSFYPAPERLGFLDTQIHRLQYRKRLYKFIKRMWLVIEKIGIFNQKMLFYVRKP